VNLDVERDPCARSLLDAQRKAESLFAEIVGKGLLVPGRLESEVSAAIHELAHERFGVKRHWHKRIVRAGPNTMLSYYDRPADRRLTQDDIVYLDLGPIFEAWEADFGRTYVIGDDDHKQRLVRDIETAFHQGKALYEQQVDLTCGQLYDYVESLARSAGWEFGNSTAGHLVGEFPHERVQSGSAPLSIRHGNDLKWREPAADGSVRHWILEIHFIDRQRQIGGFFEQLLTVPDLDQVPADR
jgi:Xaa-Pro aminopeptidase